MNTNNHYNKHLNNHNNSNPPSNLLNIVREQRGLTLHCCIKFFLLLILVAKGLYVQKLLDDML